VRVGTPLGEYPFEFRRLERRGSSLAVVGSLAGYEASVVLGPDDLRALALPVAALALLVAWRRSAR
jgi:hypothetical protein